MTFLDEVRKKLDLPPAEKEQVMRELESHYHEVEDEALSNGMNECEASAEAAKRLGDPSDIAQRMQTVHTRATWKTAFLTALPFLGFAITTIFIKNKYGLAGILITILISAFFVIGSIRELAADRRPLWLATWLPASIKMMIRLAVVVARGFLQNGSARHTSEIYILLNAIYFGMGILLIGSLAVWVYKQSWTWNAAIFGIIIVVSFASLLMPQMISNAYISMYAQLLIGGLSFAIVMILLSVRLFLNHPYGRLVQMPLMLYTFLISGLPNGGSGLDAAAQILWEVVITSFISCLTIILITRVSQWQVKQWIFSAAIITLGMAEVIKSTIVPNSPSINIMLVSSPALTTMVYLVLIVFVPELIDRHYKKHRPELAH